MFAEIPIYIPVILVGLFLLGFISMLTAEKFFKFIANSIGGIVFLLLYNILFSGITGIYIGINLVTVLLVVILGIPGFLLLLLLNLIL